MCRVGYLRRHPPEKAGPAVRGSSIIAMSDIDVFFREVVAQILDEMPSDPTDIEDMVHSSLFLGKPRQALSEAAQLDIWLAAHLADIMEPIEIIDSEPDE